MSSRDRSGTVRALHLHHPPILILSRRRPARRASRRRAHRKTDTTLSTGSITRVSQSLTASGIYVCDGYIHFTTAPTGSNGAKVALATSDTLTVNTLQLFVTSLNARCCVDLLDPLGDLGHREVLVAIVHRFELAAVDRNNGASEQAQARAKLTARIASPLCFRKSAIVLKSGASRPTNPISSILRCASRSSRRLDCRRLR